MELQVLGTFRYPWWSISFLQITFSCCYCEEFKNLQISIWAISNLSMLFYHVLSYSLNRDICHSFCISSCSYWKFICLHFLSIPFVHLPLLSYFPSAFFSFRMLLSFTIYLQCIFGKKTGSSFPYSFLTPFFFLLFLNFIWDLHTQATSPLFWCPKCRKPGHLHRNT